MLSARQLIYLVLMCSLVGQTATAANKVAPRTNSSKTAALDTAFNKANALLAAGKNLEASQAFWQLSQSNPKCVQCFWGLASAYERQNRLQEAGIIYQNIVSLTPSDITPWFRLIENYERLGDANKYTWAVQQCAARFPNESRIRALLADLHTSRNKMLGAQRTSTQKYAITSVQMDDDIGSLLTSAYALKDAGRYDEAITKIKKCLEMLPNDPQLYTLLDSLYVCQGNLEEALAVRKEFVRRFPANPKSRSFRDQIKYYDQDFQTIRKYEKSGLATDNPNYCWSSSDMPLKVYVHERAKGRTIWSAEQAKAGINPRQAYGAIIEDCLNAWTAASGRGVTFVIVDSLESANIEIDWTEDESKLSHSFSSGEAHSATNSRGQRMSKIYVLTVSRHDGKPIGKDEFRETCLHEIGHALGLAHSSNTADVMYTQWHPKSLTALSKNDVARIRKLYLK